MKIVKQPKGMENLRTKMLMSVRETAFKHYKVKPFDSDYLEVYKLTTILKYLFSSVSIITGYFYFNSIFQGTLDPLAVIIIIVTILICLESLKYFITPKSLNRFFKGKYVEWLLLFIFGFPLYAASVFVSVNGAKEIFKQREVIEKEAKVELKVDVDSVANYYDKKISVEQKKLDAIMNSAIKSNTLKWKTTVDQLTRLEERIDATYAEKKAELNRLRLENKEEEAEQLAVDEYKVGKIVYIGFITETLLFLCFLFGEYYLSRSYKGQQLFRNKKYKIRK